MKKSYAAAAVACSALLGLSLVAAPAASAYPPGKKQTTKVNKSVFGPGAKAKATVTNAQPGCRATFAVVNKSGKAVSSTRKTVSRKNNASVTLRMPVKPGKYTVRTTISGSGCTKATSSAKVTVKRPGKSK